MVFILCLYDLYVHVVTVEIYDTKYTSINGKQVVTVETYVKTI